MRYQSSLNDLRACSAQRSLVQTASLTGGEPPHLLCKPPSTLASARTSDCSLSFNSGRVRQVLCALLDLPQRISPGLATAESTHSGKTPLEQEETSGRTRGSPCWWKDRKQRGTASFICNLKWLFLMMSDVDFVAHIRYPNIAQLLTSDINQ